MKVDQDVLARLERLERQNRRFRRSSAALAALLVVSVAAGFSRPSDDVVEAKGFVLVDDAGEELARLGTDGNGDALFRMKNEKAEVALTASGPGLLLRGSDGKRYAFMGIDTRGRTALELASDKLVDGVRMAVEADGSAAVAVHGPHGYARAKMATSTADDSSSVSVFGPQASLRGSFGVDPKGNSNSILIDPTGRPRVGMVVQENGTPSVSLSDESTRPRANLTMQFDGEARLEFLRTDGKPSHVLP